MSTDGACANQVMSHGDGSQLLTAVALAVAALVREAWSSRSKERRKSS